MQELKPCPYCGANANALTMTTAGALEAVYIKCLACKASGPLDPPAATKRQAVKRWNSRGGLQTNGRIVITIPGKPIAKKRPRFARRGKGVATYNDQATEEEIFIIKMREQLKAGARIPAAAYQIRCIFHMPIPKSMPKYKRQLVPLNQIHHVKTPDVDNMLKFVCDCLNNEVWQDDSAVISKHGIKRYSFRPRTEIMITKII